MNNLYLYRFTDTKLNKIMQDPTRCIEKLLLAFVAQFDHPTRSLDHLTYKLRSNETC